MHEGNSAITAALMAPFIDSEIEERKGRGNKMFPYVAGENVLRRLIDATNNCFDVDVLAIECRPRAGVDGSVLGEQWIARVQLTIPGMGRRTAIGEKNIENNSGEDMIKGVITDGIKKAATYFGVGLQLYDDAPAIPPDWQKFLDWLKSDAKMTPADYQKAVGKWASEYETPKLAYAELIKVRPDLAPAKTPVAGGK